LTEGPDPITEPLPNLQVALAAQAKIASTASRPDAEPGGGSELGGGSRLNRRERGATQKGVVQPDGLSKPDRVVLPRPASDPGLPRIANRPADHGEPAGGWYEGHSAGASDAPVAPPTKKAQAGPRGAPNEAHLPVQIWPPVQAESPAQTQSPVRTEPPVQAEPRATTEPPAQTQPAEQTEPAEQAPHSLRGLAASIALPTRARQSVTASAVRVRAPRPAAGRKARRRGPRVAGVAALSVILVAAAAVAVVLSSGASGTQPRSSPSQQRKQPSRATITANLAAGFVSGQVSHSVVVACDKAMCQMLTAHGFPGRHLQLIRPNSTYPLQAQVVVVTRVVQRQFGSSLATNWAPAVLANFGRGGGAISVRVIAQKGAAVYQSALKADLSQRQVTGATLLAGQWVRASATARKALVAGQPDARLIVLLSALAAVHPIDILDFGPVAPGASVGVPLRTADLAVGDLASGLARSDYLRYLRNVLNAEPPPYRPDVARIAHDAEGKLIFQIRFAAPSPIGLLGGQRP
jgi:hypothetical protein